MYIVYLIARLKCDFAGVSFLSDHGGYHFVTVFDNRFANAAPQNSRHYFEHLQHYHNNKNGFNTGQEQNRPTHIPIGQAPVLYSPLHTKTADQGADVDSAESIMSPPAMIVGIENLILFCHFDDNEADTLIYMNHDDVEAEEAKEDNEQKAKFLLGLMMAGMGKPGGPQLNPLEVLASLNGLNVPPGQERSGLFPMPASNPSNSAGQTTVPVVDGQGFSPLQPPQQPPLSQPPPGSDQPNLDRLFASMNKEHANPTYPLIRDTPTTPVSNGFTSTDATPLQFSI